MRQFPQLNEVNESNPLVTVHTNLGDFTLELFPEVAPKTLVENKPELKSTTEAVPFQTIEQPDASLPKGQTKVVQEGINGERTTLTEITTVDGKQTSKVLGNTITKQPVNKVINVGTKEEATPTPQPVKPEEPKQTQPETPKPATPAGNGDNNGTPTNDGDQTQLRELPNTGTGQELSIFGAAASVILAGLGLVVPGKKKEEK